jgi:hypothetical protein
MGNTILIKFIIIISLEQFHNLIYKFLIKNNEIKLIYNILFYYFN